MQLKLRRMTDNTLPPVGVLRGQWSAASVSGTAGSGPGHDASMLMRDTHARTRLQRTLAVLVFVQYVCALQHASRYTEYSSHLTSPDHFFRTNIPIRSDPFQCAAKHSVIFELLASSPPRLLTQFHIVPYAYLELYTRTRTVQVRILYYFKMHLHTPSNLQ